MPMDTFEIFPQLNFRYENSMTHVQNIVKILDNLSPPMDGRKSAKILFHYPAHNIFGDVRPDEDRVGSQLALGNILKANDIQYNIVTNDNYGSILSQFLEGYTLISDAKLDATLPLICVDCSDFQHVGSKIGEKSAKPYLNTDHLISNDNFADHHVVEANGFIHC
jgi:hypothetical protein